MIQQVSDMQMRLLSLPSADDPQAVQLTAALKAASQDSRSFFNSLKQRITTLDQGNANLRAMIPLGQSACNLSLDDVRVRAQQVDALRDRFKSSIERYAEVERDHRAKNRSRLERQVTTVNPNMGPEELQGIVREAEQNGGSGLFSQAVSRHFAVLVCVRRHALTFCLALLSSCSPAASAHTPPAALCARSSPAPPSWPGSSRP